uniref:Protein Skeletor n=1 Tax=Syphacia muris TaxID=451379 RepID=A0A0N5AUG4_9BILA
MSALDIKFVLLYMIDPLIEVTSIQKVSERYLNDWKQISLDSKLKNDDDDDDNDWSSGVTRKRNVVDGTEDGQMEGAGGWVPAAAAAADGKKGIIRCSKKNYYVMDENGVYKYIDTQKIEDVVPAIKYRNNVTLTPMFTPVNLHCQGSKLHAVLPVLGTNQQGLPGPFRSGQSAQGKP